jgi:hypothetical protein
LSKTEYFDRSLRKSLHSLSYDGLFAVSLLSSGTCSMILRHRALSEFYVLETMYFFLSNLVIADQNSIIVSSSNLSLPFQSPETRSFWYSLDLQELVLELVCLSFEFVNVGQIVGSQGITDNKLLADASSVQRSSSRLSYSTIDRHLYDRPSFVR